MRYDMKNRIGIIGLAAVVVTLCLVMSGCGGGGGGSTAATGAIEGYVYVPAGVLAANDTRAAAVPTGYAPLSSASIEVSSGIRTFQTTTDASGHFSVNGLPVGAASVRVVPPTGMSYRSLDTTVNVAGNSTTMIGEEGKVSLLSSAAASLAVSIAQIDLSTWPTVKLHVDVDDPSANIRLMGLQSGSFTVRLNGVATAVEQVQIDDGYVLTLTARDATAQQCAVVVDSSFCDRSGSANAVAARQINRFILPVGGSSVTYDFKDSAYTVLHPGMWHMGVDYGVQAGTPVYAVARGEVVRRVINGQVTGLIIKHLTTENLQTTSGATHTFYAVYGYINATVSNGSMVQAGQQIGTVAQWTPGTHLHFGIRVGQDITAEWRLSTMVGGHIPSADANGWTSGWADPAAFFEDHTPDNN